MPTHLKHRSRPRLGRALCLFCWFAAAILALGMMGSSRAVGQEGCSLILLLREDFDGVTPPALPLGWSSTTWVTSNSGVPMPPADTLPNAALIDAPAAISDKPLDSPSIFLSQGGELAQITFGNNFNLQDGFDGGVLEISRAGTPFQDILAVGGTFASGGYNGTISNCCGNPLAGRQAWTGNSGRFITTVVHLPINWGPNMVLRWRMGSDSSVSGQGWRVDNIVVTQCHKPVPSVTPTPSEPPPPPTPKPTPTARPRPTPAPRPP